MLLWINQQHIIAAPAARLAKDLIPFLEQMGIDPSCGPKPADVADAFRQLVETMQHMASRARFCYEDFDELDVKSAKKLLRPVILEPLVAARDALAAVPD